MREAQYWEKTKNNIVQCRLCPNNCKLLENERGLCHVRKNIGGVLYSENYELISALNIDPIEKKPLYHFYPGKKILSIGSIGCNLKCKFCQNWEIAQCSIDSFKWNKKFKTNELIEAASTYPECIGIAFTYNEPSVWYEYMLDVAKAAKEKKLKTIMVSNGYINEEPLIELIPYIDAFSIDLKAYTDEFYREVSKGKLEPVLKTLEIIKKFSKHIEIDFLLIPELNDKIEVFIDMINWIKDNLGEETALHINRYYPNYKLNNPPTAEKALINFYNEAIKVLKYVYLGNIQTNIGENTYCSKCKSELIKRHRYTISPEGINIHGNCLYCGNKVVINN